MHCVSTMPCVRVNRRRFRCGASRLAEWCAAHGVKKGKRRAAEVGFRVRELFLPPPFFFSLTRRRTPFRRERSERAESPPTPIPGRGCISVGERTSARLSDPRRGFIYNELSKHCRAASGMQPLTGLYRDFGPPVATDMKALTGFGGTDTPINSPSRKQKLMKINVQLHGN